MTQVYSRLCDTQVIADTTSVLYTLPGGGPKAFIKKIVLHNTDSSTRDVQMHFVPNGEVYGYEYRFLNVSLEANETLILDDTFPYIMQDAAETLEASASVAGVVTVSVYGMVES